MLTKQHQSLAAADVFQTVLCYLGGLWDALIQFCSTYYVEQTWVSNGMLIRVHSCLKPCFVRTPIIHYKALYE